MIHIIGEGNIVEAQAFNDVRTSLEFDYDVYLGAMWAKPLGIELRDVPIYNMEYLYPESEIWRIGYLETLRNNIVIDYSARNVEYLKSLGIEAFFMPYGYHKSQQRLRKGKKDIDVLFVGSTHHARRVNLLNDLSKKCKLVVAKNCYGSELDKTIAKAKVQLNFHHTEGQPLEVVRVNYLMANHCNVVSETSDTPQYKDGLRFADYGDLINTCLDAMENPIDGFETISNIPQDCSAANEWLKGKL